MGAYLDRLRPSADSGALDRVLLSVFGHAAAGWMGSTGGMSFVRPHTRMSATGMEKVHGYEERHAGGAVHDYRAMAGRVADTALGVPHPQVRPHLMAAHHALAGGDHAAAVQHLTRAHAAGAGLHDTSGRPVQHLVARHLGELGAHAPDVALHRPSPVRPAEAARPSALESLRSDLASRKGPALW